MRQFRADLHIHTVLSACADLEMSPGNIVSAAKQQQLDLIAITDHNSTLNCAVVKEMADECGLAVLLGVEVTTREEVHCLAYFRRMEELHLFQQYLEIQLPKIAYNPENFGYQAVVDRNEQIIQLVDNYLNVALNQSIDEVEREVHRLGGLFVPAHIERPMYGIINQLGFLPPELKYDALGIMWQSQPADIRTKFRLKDSAALIKASDAHSLTEIGAGYCQLEMNELTFEEIQLALLGQDGRRISE